jgi:hypothetical protein
MGLLVGFRRPAASGPTTGSLPDREAPEVEAPRTARRAGRSRTGAAVSVGMVTALLRARADVATDAPARYAKQLVSHLGRRVEWVTEGPASTAPIAGGTGVVEVGDGVLVLRAQAADAETLDRVQDVLGRHLERFGQRNELVVTWRSDPLAE